MNMPYVFKRCTKCGEWLVANKINFHKDKNGKYGLKSRCKKCEKKYRENNKDKIKQKQKQWYENNKEYVKKYGKQWYENNKEYALEYRKQWRENNKEYGKQYYENNKNKIKEYKKQWYEYNKEYKKEYDKEYHKNNPEKSFNNCIKRRSKLKNQGRGISNEQYKVCNKWFDWKCAYSGEKLQKNKSTYGRTLDHIIALDNGGLNEPWNIVPMRRGYNSSKNSRTDSMTWYLEQEYFDIDRLNKIVEWQIYAYEKWGGEEFGELILITDLLED